MAGPGERASYRLDQVLDESRRSGEVIPKIARGERGPAGAPGAVRGWRVLRAELGGYLGAIPAARSEPLWAAAACAARLYLSRQAMPDRPLCRDTAMSPCPPAPQRWGGNYSSHGRAGRAPPPSWAVRRGGHGRGAGGAGAVGRGGRGGRAVPPAARPGGR